MHTNEVRPSSMHANKVRQSCVRQASVRHLEVPDAHVRPPERELQTVVLGARLILDALHEVVLARRPGRVRESLSGLNSHLLSCGAHGADPPHR